jgi:hypothetical protein
VIWAFSRRHRVSHHNVTDSREVLVLAAASETAYVDDSRDVPSNSKQKIKKHRTKSAV